MKFRELSLTPEKLDRLAAQAIIYTPPTRRPEPATEKEERSEKNPNTTE